MSRILLGSVAPNIHSLTDTDTYENDDELIIYDNSAAANRKTKLSEFISGIKSLITAIPYICDNLLGESSADFSKIKAADDEGRPVFMNYRGKWLRMYSCGSSIAEFQGIYASGTENVKLCLAEVESDNSLSYRESPVAPFPCVVSVKLTESGGVISANKTDSDFAVAFTFGLPIVVKYAGIQHYYSTSKTVGTSNVRYFYAVIPTDAGTAVSEVTLTVSGSTESWAHRTI